MLNIVANIIINPKNQVLLLNRKKPPYQEWWAFPGGKIEQGEDIVSALQRETLEETKIKTTNPQLIAILNEKLVQENQLKNHFVIFYFKTRTNTQEIQQKITKEGTLQWFQITNPPSNMVPSDKKILEITLQNNKKITYIEGTINQIPVNKRPVLTLTEWRIIQ